MRLYYSTKNGYKMLKYKGKVNRIATDRFGDPIYNYEKEGDTIYYAEPADILVPFDTSFSIMDEQSETSVELVCSNSSPLLPGTLVRLVYFPVLEESAFTTNQAFPLSGIIQINKSEVVGSGAITSGVEIMSLNNVSYGVKGTVTGYTSTTVTLSNFRIAKTWEAKDKDGKPHNYANWVILGCNASYYDHFDTYGERYKHSYDMEEVSSYLKDFPVRSTKTFGAGKYTWRDVLEITLKLFFKTSVIPTTYSVKDNPLLDEKISKLSYTNSTVYDVISDIGRTLDLTPNVEVLWDDYAKRYVFELEFLPNYGEVGDEVDISYFDQAFARAENSDRDTNAGAVLSNVQNLFIENAFNYPFKKVGLYPGNTNVEAEKTKFVLPSGIRKLKEIKVYYRHNIAENENGYDRVNYWGGSALILKGSPINWGKEIDKENYLSITENGSSAPVFSVQNFYDGTILTSSPYGVYQEYNKDLSKSVPKQLFVSEKTMEKYLYDDLPDYTLQSKKNTIFYEQGSNEIDLTALYNNTYFFVGSRAFSSAASTPITDIGFNTVYGYFGDEDSSITGSINYVAVADSIKPYIEIVYEPYVSGAIKGEGYANSDTTVFFNQYGQVVSATSFGNAMENYADEMSGSHRVVGKSAFANAEKSFYELYHNLPQVGCTVIDGGKRYVLSMLSITRSQQSLGILAQLDERKKGRSRVVQADSTQELSVIPDKDIQESNTVVHFVLNVDIAPIEENISEPYDEVSSRLKEFLLNPLLRTDTPVDYVLSFQGDNPNDALEDYNICALPFALATTKRSVLFSSRFNQNKSAGTLNGDAVLYTTEGGEIDTATIKCYAMTKAESALSKFPLFTPPATDEDLLFSTTFPLKKDELEKTNITIQSTVSPQGNLLLGSSYIKKTPFGSSPAKSSDALQIMFYDHLITSTYDAAGKVRYSVTVTNGNKINISWVKETPTHKAWALISGQDVLLYSNKAISGNSIDLYTNLILTIV